MTCLNIAAYRFVTLTDLPALRERLHEAAASRGLKGTVLLAEEGINLFLAGEARAVRAWRALLCEDARFTDIEVKESHSDTQPFQRLKVKIKREIIRMATPRCAPKPGGRRRSMPPRWPAGSMPEWTIQAVR